MERKKKKTHHVLQFEKVIEIGEGKGGRVCIIIIKTDAARARISIRPKGEPVVGGGSRYKKVAPSVASSRPKTAPLYYNNMMCVIHMYRIIIIIIIVLTCTRGVNKHLST